MCREGVNDSIVLGFGSKRGSKKHRNNGHRQLNWSCVVEIADNSCWIRLLLHMDNIIETLFFFWLLELEYILAHL